MIPFAFNVLGRVLIREVSLREDFSVDPGGAGADSQVWIQQLIFLESWYPVKSKCLGVISLRLDLTFVLILCIHKQEKSVCLDCFHHVLCAL